MKSHSIASSALWSNVSCAVAMPKEMWSSRGKAHAYPAHPGRKAITVGASSDSFSGVR
jgi:hypothetical protein